MDPSLSTAWAVLALVTTEQDSDYVLAMSQFDKAVELDPKNATAWFWRGLNYARLGYAEKSISDILHCLEIDPAYLNCYRHLARAYLMNGEVDKSLETYLVNVSAGLAINDFWVIHPLLARDNKLAAALLLIQEAQGARDYPYKEMLEAVENPKQDHTAVLLKFAEWLTRTGGKPELKISEWIALGAWDRVGHPLDIHQVWFKSAANYRASPYFKPLVRKVGWLRYWQEYDFPPQCRPLEQDDFECD